MARVSVELSNLLVVLFITLLLLGWLVFMLKKGLISLAVAQKRQSGFDPTTMSVGFPTSQALCPKDYTAHRGTSTSLSSLQQSRNLQEMLEESIKPASNLDGAQELQRTTLARIRLYQWRLGMVRMLMFLYCLAVIIQIWLTVGPVTLIYYTVWNFYAITVYFAISGSLSLSEFFTHVSDIDMIASEKCCSLEMSCISLMSQMWGYLPFVFVTNRDIREPTECGSCLRKISWLLLSLELTSSVFVFLVVWFVLYPIGNQESRQTLESFSNISMHVVNVVFIWMDYLIIPVSLKNVSWDMSSVSISDDSTHICKECTLTIQSWMLMCLIVIYLFSTWMNHELGSHWPYFFLDPSESSNGIWYVLLAMVNLGIWMIVYYLDTRCLNKSMTQVRLMKDFFDAVQPSVLEMNTGLSSVPHHDRGGFPANVIVDDDEMVI